MLEKNRHNCVLRSRKVSLQHKFHAHAPGGVVFPQLGNSIFTIKLQWIFFHFNLYFWGWLGIYIPDKWQLPAVFCRRKAQWAHLGDLASPSHSGWAVKHCAAPPPSSPGTHDLQTLSWLRHSVPQVGGSREGHWHATWGRRIHWLHQSWIHVANHYGDCVIIICPIMCNSHRGQISHFCHFFPRLNIHSVVNSIIIDHNDDHR